MTFENTIKEYVSCRDLLDRLGIDVTQNKALCPFHADNSPSMQIFDDGFKCWSCGEHGDVIDLAEAYYGLAHKEAVARLNKDFNLHLPISEEITEDKRKDMEKAEKERKRTMELQKLKNTAAEVYYWFLFDKVAELELTIRVMAPQTVTAPLHPLFVAAIKDLPMYAAELECVEARRTMRKR